MYATVMQGRGGKVWLCYSSRERRKGGGDGKARQGTETRYTTGGLSQDRLPRQVLRQGACRATDPLSLDVSCEPVMGQLPVMNPFFVTCLEPVS